MPRETIVSDSNQWPEHDSHLEWIESTDGASPGGGTFAASVQWTGDRVEDGQGLGYGFVQLSTHPKTPIHDKAGNVLHMPEDGFYVTLGADEIKRLIKVLRRASRSAYPAS